MKDSEMMVFKFALLIFKAVTTNKLTDLAEFTPLALWYKRSERANKIIYVLNNLENLILNTLKVIQPYVFWNTLRHY